MKTLIRPAISLFILLTLITGVIYPVLITGLAQLLFPLAANGSLILQHNQPIGSTLIGQNFTLPKYFWGRLSATTTTPYNGAASGGSNFGPLNPAVITAAHSRIIALLAVDSTNQQPVPIDLITASASGLDPHISPAAALYQAERIARARNLKIDAVRQLIVQYTENQDLGFLGTARINVLKLNLALDAMKR